MGCSAMMINDRKIIISVGNHRRSVNWQPQTLLLSELYEKLRVPARGTETMQEYLALRKSEQDDRKDVGGYVAGSLAGTRRKAGAVTGRDVVTLDLDDGSQVECEILTIFTVGERDYIALLPLDENGEENEEGEVFIYRYSEDSEGNPSLDNIEDDEEYEAVSDRFDELLDEAAFEEMDD